MRHSRLAGRHGRQGHIEKHALGQNGRIREYIETGMCCAVLISARDFESRKSSWVWAHRRFAETRDRISNFQTCPPKVFFAFMLCCGRRVVSLTDSDAACYTGESLP
jgi:hypothetical protein